VLAPRTVAIGGGPAGGDEPSWRYLFAAQALPVSLLDVGSVVLALTPSLRQTEPTDDRQGTLIVTVGATPEAIVVHVQVTLWPTTEQVPPFVVTIDGGGPTNRLEVALSWTCWLSLGPLLRTVTRNVAVPFPGFPLAAAVWLTARSARVMTVEQVCCMSFVASGSVVEDDVVALMQNRLPSTAEAVRPSTSLKPLVVVGASVVRVQLMLPEAPTAGVVQLQPVGALSDVKVAPLGTAEARIGDAELLGPALEIAREYESGVPATASVGSPVDGAAGPVAVPDRSARVTTVAVPVPVSLPGAGSGVVEETVAVLVSTVPAAVAAGTCTVTVNEAELPEDKEPFAQVTGPVPVQVKPVPDALTSDVPVGSTSLTDTLSASVGPEFETVTPKETSSPATAVPEALVVDARSAELNRYS
jgi:hypothetical protein